MAKVQYIGGHPTASFTGEGELTFSSSPGSFVEFKKSLFKSFMLPFSDIRGCAAVTGEHLAGKDRADMAPLAQFTKNQLHQATPEENYLTLSYFVSGESFSVIFQAPDAAQLCDEINAALQTWKQKKGRA